MGANSPTTEIALKQAGGESEYFLPYEWQLRYLSVWLSSAGSHSGSERPTKGAGAPKGFAVCGIEAKTTTSLICYFIESGRSLSMLW